MKTAIAAALLATAAILPGVAFAAAQPQTGAAQARPVRYTARQFYETTSYGMAAATGIAFSRDGRNLLIHSDRSGVFNVGRRRRSGPDQPVDHQCDLRRDLFPE